MARYYMMTLSPAAAVLAGTALAGGNLLSPSLLAFLVLLLGWTEVERRGVQQKNVKDSDSDKVMRISRIGWFLSIFVAAADSARHEPSAWVFPMIGFLLFISGMALRYLAMRELKGFFSYSLKVDSGHKVVDSGPYRYVRHPSYSGMLLLSLGIPMIFTSLPGLLLITLSTLPNLLWRIRKEERMLLEGLGTDYAGYIKGTKKLLPLVY